MTDRLGDKNSENYPVLRQAFQLPSLRLMFEGKAGAIQYNETPWLRKGGDWTIFGGKVVIRKWDETTQEDLYHKFIRFFVAETDSCLGRLYFRDI
jgi:hypothetical protein